MRLTINHLFIFFTLLIQACSDANQQANPEAIYAYIETHINQRKYDTRLYDPPPPPELQDSVRHSGRIKPDSITNKLKPLRIYINPIVDYDTIVPQVKSNSIGDLSFIGERQNIPLRIDSNQFSKKEGITLLATQQDEFFSTYKELYLDEGYGGFVSFHNLYCSKNGQNAYFEVSYFKGRLNATTYAVFCTKQKDGTWTFKSQLLSIS